MKLFVTGATGFIGRNLVRRLVNEGHSLTVNLFGNESSPFSSEVNVYRLEKKRIEDDIAFFKSSGFDGIIHLASLYLVSHKQEEVTELVQSNVGFGTYVVECAVQAKIKWFLNTGTFWQHFNDADYSPVNLYAASKQAFECMAQYYIDTNKIQFCTLKLSDTFGKDDSRPKVFNLWLKNAFSDTTLEMSPGEQVLDISYIDDIVDAYTILVEKLSDSNNAIPNGEVFAVKAEKRFSLKELAAQFEKSTGLSLKINWGGRKYREREVMKPWTKGTVVPGWKPKVSIADGIKMVVSHLKS